MSGLYGNKKSYSTDFTLEKNISEATLCNWTTPDTDTKRSLTKYLLCYTDDNGYFELILKKQSNQGEYQEVERKRFRLNRGSGGTVLDSSSSTGSGRGSGDAFGDLIALDGYDWNVLKFDYQQKEVQVETVPPNLIINTDTNQV